MLVARPITCSSLPFHINLEHYHHRHDYNNGWTLTGSLLPYHIHFRAGLSTQERIQHPLGFNYLERFHQSPALDFYSVVGATTTKSSTKSLASSAGKKARQVFSLRVFILKEHRKNNLKYILSHEKEFFGFQLLDTGPSYCTNSTLCTAHNVQCEERR